MPSLAINSLATVLKQSLKPMYIIHGEEDLLRIEALDLLRSNAKEQGYLNKELFTVDTYFNWSELMIALDSPGLFSELKLLEIHIPNGKPGREGGEALSHLAERLPEDTVVVLFLPKLESAQFKSKWYKAVASVAQVIEAKAVGIEQLPAWIKSRLVPHQLEIEADALALFAEKVEGNLLAAKQEIDKLGLLYPAGHKLTLVEAQGAIANVARYDVYQLSAAWMCGDLNKLIRQLEGLVLAAEPPVILLGAVSADIRILIRLKAALKEGKTIFEMRNSLRLWGDKQHHVGLAVKRLSPKQLMGALQQCAQIDRQIKGAEAGDVWTSFHQLMLSLAN